MKNPGLIDQDCAIGKAVSFHNLRFRYSRPQARLSSGWSRRYKEYATKAKLYRAPTGRAIESGELRIKGTTITRAQAFQGEHVRRSKNLQIPLSEANFTEINHLMKPNSDAPAHHVITTDDTTAVRQ